MIFKFFKEKSILMKFYLKQIRIYINKIITMKIKLILGAVQQRDAVRTVN